MVSSDEESNGSHIEVPSSSQSLQKGDNNITILSTNNLLSGKKKAVKKSSKDRVAKWRANLSDENRKIVRKKQTQLKQSQRAMQSNEDRQLSRELDRDRKAKKRASMTNEEKSKQKEKDRLRKAEKRASLSEKEKSNLRVKDRMRKSAAREPPPENWRSLPREYKGLYTYKYHVEQERNRLYKENRRKENTEAEAEFERIQNLLIKRKTRAKRSDEERKEQNAKAKNGMQFLPMIPFKSRRKSKGQRKEYMWWQFWKKGDENKELLRTKLPKYGTRFDQWDSKSENPYKMDEEKEEKWNAMSHCEKMHEKNKLRRKMIKEQLQQPIDMPELELSEYEKIREKIIAEQDAEFQKYMIELDVKNSKN